MQQNLLTNDAHRPLFVFLFSFVLLLAVANFWTEDAVKGSFLLALSAAIGLYVVGDALRK